VQIVSPDGSSKLAYGFVSGVFGCAATGNNDEVCCSRLIFLGLHGARAIKGSRGARAAAAAKGAAGTWHRNPALTPGVLVQGGRRSDAARDTRETEGRRARGGRAQPSGACALGFFGRGCTDMERVLTVVPCRLAASPCHAHAPPFPRARPRRAKNRIWVPQPYALTPPCGRPAPRCVLVYVRVSRVSSKKRRAGL